MRDHIFAPFRAGELQAFADDFFDQVDNFPGVDFAGAPGARCCCGPRLFLGRSFAPVFEASFRVASARQKLECRFGVLDRRFQRLEICQANGSFQEITGSLQQIAIRLE